MLLCHYPNIYPRLNWLQTLLGLHYLHNMKVLHRDMKSANVFLMKYPDQNYYCVKIGELDSSPML